MEFGLPVRRMPGGAKARVYALRSELDVWLRQARSPDRPQAPPPTFALSELKTSRRGLNPKRRVGLLVGAVAAVGALTLLIGQRLTVSEEGSRASAPSAEARALTQQGVYAWNRRTPQGLTQAIDAFTRAVVLDPKDTAAYVGLADCYNLGPEFSAMRPDDAYPRARAAALRALSLSPHSAEAHRALGFGDFWWRRDVVRGFAEMREASRLAPSSAVTHHWLANMMAVRGDARALQEIDAALALEPETPVLADKGFVLVMLGRLDEAKAVLRKVAELQPDYPVAHDYLLLLSRRLGDEADVLREGRIAAQLRHQAALATVLADAEHALVNGGVPAARRDVAAQQAKLRAVGESDSFQTALAESDLHHRDSALGWLFRARAEHHPAMLSLPTSPDFEWLRSDPAFSRLIQAS